MDDGSQRQFRRIDRPGTIEILKHYINWHGSSLALGTGNVHASGNIMRSRSLALIRSGIISRRAGCAHCVMFVAGRKRPRMRRELRPVETCPAVLGNTWALARAVPSPVSREQCTGSGYDGDPTVHRPPNLSRHETARQHIDPL
jgi:hypothetical protein